MGFWKTARRLNNIFILGYWSVTMPKQCSVPIQPVRDRIVQTTMKGIKPKNILVIDEFKRNNVSLDLDSRGELAHGFMTSKIIEDGLPNANVYKKDIGNPFLESDNYIKDSIAEPILKDMRAGKRYDAANISLGVEVGFDDLSEMLGEEITSKNIASKKRKVKDYLLNNPDKTVKRQLLVFKCKSKDIMPLVDCMDSLSSKGTKVFVSAGNDGKNKFNLLSLIDNSITVGALDKKGGKTYYTEDHSLVKRWAKGNIPLKKTDNGYQIQFDKSTKDIEKSQTTGFWHATLKNDIEGTSFSAPRALVEELNK